MISRNLYFKSFKNIGLRRFLEKECLVKLELSKDLVRKLTFDEKPVGKDAAGKVVFSKNTKNEAYFIFDTHRDAPIGFALKVASTKKVFVVQRKVENKTIRSTLGDATDLLAQHTLDGVRILAAKIASQIRETKSNPSTRQEQKAPTLGYAFAQYHKFLTERNDKKISPETFRSLKQARERLAKWEHTFLQDLDAETVLNEFKLNAATPTANELAFRFASTAVNRLIDFSSLDPKNIPLRNPFRVLTTQKMYRSAATLDAQYEASRTRNPLKDKSSLGSFLKALWVRREKGDRVGCDYLLLTLLFAARKSETSRLRWVEMLTDEEKTTSSYVDLKNRIAHFFDTKNKRNHKIPISDCALQLLRARQVHNIDLLQCGNVQDRTWVFPAKGATNKHGYYKDPSDLLGRICMEANISKFTLHDLRRTWGAWSVQVQIYEQLSRDYMNHQSRSVHRRYTDAEWDFYTDQINRVEQAMLQTCPSVWNALKPLTAAPVLADDPVVKPLKSVRRPGRPKKNS